jgi:hypothetical protein
MLPISANCGFWYFLLVMPTIPLQLYLITLDLTDQPKWLASTVFISEIIVGLGVLAIAAPWGFEWYVMALTLMFGSKIRAEQKEVWLLDELQKQ